MQRKSLKIDWDDLEEAFNNPPDEVIVYLDRVTGHVVLEGEGERDEFDDDGPIEVQRVAASTPAVPANDDALRLYVRPPDTGQKVEWMKVFLEQEDGLDEGIRTELREALDAPDPAAAVGRILRRAPTERDAWFLYRARRLRVLIDDWLDRNGIDPVAPPPWRG